MSITKNYIFFPKTVKSKFSVNSKLFCQSCKIMFPVKILKAYFRRTCKITFSAKIYMNHNYILKLIKFRSNIKYSENTINYPNYLENIKIVNSKHF